jgi:hypothetical protein
MRTLVVAITALATVSIAGTALAQQRSARELMSEMKAKYGDTFDRCQSLAISRGHNFRDDATEVGANMPFMMFIEGCIMGQQR